MPEERPEAYRSCALRIGSYIVIQKVLKEYKLPGMLEKHLGQDYGLFLDLVSFMIVDEENVGLHYDDKGKEGTGSFTGGKASQHI